jgi:hypothetical protein
MGREREEFKKKIEFL